MNQPLVSFKPKAELNNTRAPHSTPGPLSNLESWVWGVYKSHQVEFTVSSVMGLIAQVVERPARDWKDVGSSPTPARSFSDSMDAVSNEYHM